MILFLNDVAGSEVLLILLFILIFFGSKSIPGIARTVGRTMRQIQDATHDIKTEIKKSTDDYKKDLNLDGIFKDTAQEIKRPLDQMVDDLDHSIKYTPPVRKPVVPLDQQAVQEENPVIPQHIGKEEIQQAVSPEVTEQTTQVDENPMAKEGPSKSDENM